MKKKNVFQLIRLQSIVTPLVCIALLASCSDDDTDTGGESGGGTTAATDRFFISAAAGESQYALLTDGVSEGSTSVVGNGTEMESSIQTWLFNDDPSVALGLIYNQGDPGTGVAYDLDETGELNVFGSSQGFQLTTRFSNYGFFGDYALTSASGQTPVDESGNPLLDDEGHERSDATVFNFIHFNEDNSLTVSEKSINTLDMAGNGQQANFSGIVDLGNGEFLSGLVMSEVQYDEAGDASTVVSSPDSVWVGAFNENLELQRIYKDDRISYASGRYRSRYYSMISKDDDNNVYVFSGSYDSNTTKNAGALRINDGATDFDDDYYFDIQSLSDGYKFRQVWHITDDYFLLEFYNDLEPSGSSAAATQYGIVKMEEKTFTWVNGAMPAKDAIVSVGDPYGYDGMMYIPVTISGAYPHIYEIDPATGIATQGIEVQADDVTAIGVLSYTPAE
ncbi:protein of unknown function [Pustulibacterium marinum]|uniref:DUF4374 domain-containing protein n=1 Tax=Pustulibacterium marinum TaxID=1224947 RepID=A0A1I7IMI0_9FLAO|nr:DUF4374 domain-containing protein [Pustulibacterium marinum]SFU74112.1 protein of unknown function [Pustulibacterium marinum]